MEIMDIEKIHPELRRVIRFIPALPFHRPGFVRFSNFLQKWTPAKNSCGGIDIETQALEHASLRIYKPNQNACRAGLLWIHGGGMITGRAAQDDALCARYAKELGLTVVSVDYRLAPEHKFPAALDDCYAAWQWLIDAAEDFGLDPKRLAIGGQSAGAGLAANLAQKIFDLGGIQPAAQLLYCPMLDDRTAAQYELDEINHKIWNNKSNRAGWSAYLGHPPGQAEIAPYAVAARREDLSFLPPAWIGIGDIDLFYPEAQAYADRLFEAGVNCELYLVPMAPHAFESILPKASIAQKLFENNFQFVRTTLGILKN